MRSPAASTRRKRWSGSHTSPEIATTRSSSAVAAASGAASRASTTSRQPRSASARASARPRPRDAPVTIPFGTSPPYERPGPGRQRELVLGPWVDQPGPNGEHGGLRAVVHAELGKHVAHVRLDRLLRKVQALRDSLVRKTAPDQLEHLALARRQPVERLVLVARRERLDEPRGDDGVEQRLARMRDTHCARDLLRLCVLEQVA